MPAYNAASAAVFVDGRRNWDKLLIEPRECGLVIVGLGRPVEAPVTDIFDDDWVNRSMGFNPAAAIYDGAKGRLLLSSPMFRGLVAVDVKAPVARLLGPHDFRAMSFIYAESEHAVYFVYPDWIVGRIPNAMGGALGTLAIEDVYSKQSFRLRANDPQLDGLSVSLHYDPDASLFLFVDTASIVRVFSPDTSGEEGPVLVSRGYLDLSVGGHPAGGASEPRAKIGRWGGRSYLVLVGMTLFQVSVLPAVEPSATRVRSGVVDFAVVNEDVIAVLVEERGSAFRSILLIDSLLEVRESIHLRNTSQTAFHRIGAQVEDDRLVCAAFGEELGVPVVERIALDSVGGTLPNRAQHGEDSSRVPTR